MWSPPKNSCISPSFDLNSLIVLSSDDTVGSEGTSDDANEFCRLWRYKVVMFSPGEVVRHDSKIFVGVGSGWPFFALKSGGH